MPAGLASGLPAGWEWDYDGTRWFYTFKANGHTQYHFPSEGDEFPDFVAVGEPVPDLKPEERLESHQQVKRVTGVAPLIDRKKKSTAGNGMTATARPVGIEWDGDVGEGSSGEEEEGKKAVVFQPENLMFLGPQTYAEVSPLNEDEEEAAKRTVVGVVKGQGEGAVVSPAETTAGTPAVDKSELVRDVPEAKKEEEGRKNEAAEVVIMAEVAMPETAKEEPTTRQEEARAEDAKDTEEPARAPVQQGETITAQPMSPAAQHDVVIDVVTETDTPPPAHYAHDEPPPPPVVHPQQQPRYELPAPDTPFNPVGLIAEMPTEDTPRSHIEINPIPVEIMDTSVLAPIETAQPPPLGVAESPAAVVKQTPPPPPQQRSSSGGAPRMHMKIRRKPTDPNASIPSPLSASSSAVVSPAVVSPPSVASPSPMSVPTPPPPAAAPVAAKAQYKPYAPVSPLHRAETEPVRVPTATTGPAAQREQQESVTEPSSPVANPQLNYAPTVLRPAGQSRKSSSVSPERKQDDGGLKQGESMGGGRVQSGGMPTQESGSNVAALGGMPRQQIPPPGQVPLQGLMLQHGHSIPPGQMPPQGQTSQQGQMDPQGPQAQGSSQGQMPPQGQVLHQRHMALQGYMALQGQPQGPQGQGPLQWQVAQNAIQQPIQHGRPMSMAPGQYPPVPIPQPYGQYQQQPPPMTQQPGPHQMGQRPGPAWLAPGQQIPNQSSAIPPQQQQPPPGWIRQSMPPGYLSGQQPQLPPNGRHSMMVPSIPLNQYQPAPSPISTPDQSLLSQGRHQAQTPDSSVVSPPEPRADSRPLGPSMLVPSSMEAPPQLLPAAQPTVSAPPQEAPKPGNVKVGTGPGMKSPTADSYFPPDKDHPIGLVGNVADQFAAEMQAILGSGPNSATAAKATNATEANPEPKTLVGASSPGPGHALGRIEEHDAENASVSQDSRPSSVATKLTQSSQQPSTPQPQQLPPSQQSSPNNTPKPPQGFLPPLSGQPGVGSQGPRAGMPQPGQTTPGRMMPLSGPMGSQGPMPPQGLAPQQQWQGNMQRPPSVPPQLQMQPNKGKENKWTKWFKSSKPEKRPDAPQGGMPQQPPPPQGWGEPQQWQGQPMQGQSIQRQYVQGHPISGQPMPGQPIQGHAVHRQSIQGHPLQGQPMPGQTTLGQTTPGQTTPGQTMPGQTMPGQTMPGQTTPGQPIPGQPAQRQSVLGQPMQGQPMPGQPMPGQTMPGQTTPGQPISGQSAQRQSVPGQPMQGQPMQGQPVQGQSMQGQFIQGQPTQSHPIQRLTVQGQPMQGQPVQKAVMGGPMPLQNMPTNMYPPHQMHAGPGQGPMPQRISQQGPLGSHPPQQYMPLQPGQPMQMRPPHGFPMQQMQPGGLGSPAPSQMMPVQSPSQGSAASSPQMGFQNQSQQQTASPMPHHLMPAPLSLRPKSEVPAGMPGGG